MIRAASGPGVLHQLTGVNARRGGDITSVEIIGDEAGEATIDFEIELPEPPEPLVEELRALPIVREVGMVKTLQTIYGKRIIIMGGGAQVGQVALGAIAEADRHNIRGERISVDTIPLVGEQNLAAAVRALPRLPRVRLLVLAGALMGGEITKAVEEVRDLGLYVISLNMAGSVPDAADLVVSDPVQAGVMAVMAVADTAQFDILRQQKRRAELTAGLGKRRLRRPGQQDVAAVGPLAGAAEAAGAHLRGHLQPARALRAPGGRARQGARGRAQRMRLDASSTP